MREALKIMEETWNPEDAITGTHTLPWRHPWPTCSLASSSYNLQRRAVCPVRRGHRPKEGHRAWPAHTPAPGNVTKQQGPCPHLPDPPKAPEDGNPCTLGLSRGGAQSTPEPRLLGLHSLCTQSFWGDGIYLPISHFPVTD